MLEEITEVPSKGLGAVSWLKGQHVQGFTQMQIEKRSRHPELFFLQMQYHRALFLLSLPFLCGDILVLEIEVGAFFLNLVDLGMPSGLSSIRASCN